MEYLSLFSGIGGFELGIQQAYENKNKLVETPTDTLSKRNIEESESRRRVWEYAPNCIGFSEIDKYAIQTYQKHFNHKNYGDITKINEKELPDFDLLVGGFPCQSFSIAGKRKGFEDTRGTMFFEIARIIKEKQPRFLLLENVKGLLSHDKGNTFTTIISTLDELGYDLQWQVLNSKNFGVPQNRERVFIVGHLRGTGRPEVFPFGGTTAKDIKVVAELNSETWLKRHECIRRVHDINGISPTIPTGQGGGVMNKIMIPEATKKGYAEATEGDSINLSVPNSKTRRGRVGKGVAQTIDTGMQQYTIQPFIRNPYNGKTSDKETGTLGTSCGTSTGMTAQHLYKDSKIRRLTPKECERLQGFPDNWTEGVSDTQRYKQCGNAVTVNVVKEIIKKLIS